MSGIVPAATREISDDKDTSPVVKVFISSGGKTVSQSVDGYYPRYRICMHVLVVQSCPTLWDPKDCSSPGSSVHGILQEEYCSGLPFPSPGDLPDPGIEPGSPILQADSLPPVPPWLLVHVLSYRKFPLPGITKLIFGRINTHLPKFFKNSNSNFAHAVKLSLTSLTDLGPSVLLSLSPYFHHHIYLTKL